MSQNRDASDEFAGAAAATIVGCLGGLLFGIWQQNRRHKLEEERRLVMSGTLELRDDVSYEVKSPSLFVTRQNLKERNATLILLLLGFATLIGFTYSYVLLTEGPGILAVVGSIIGFYISYRLAKFTYRRGRQWLQHWTETKAQHHARVLHPDASHVAPLDLGQAHCYLVRLPKSTVWDSQLATRFMEQMLQKYRRLTFQIVGESGQISWRIMDLRCGLQPSVMQQAIRSFYPEAEIIREPVKSADFGKPFFRYVMGFSQPGEPMFPLKYAQKQTDPLVQITQEISDLQEGEQIVYTLFVADLARFVFDQIKNVLSVKPDFNPFQFLSPQGWLDAGIALTNRDAQRLEAYDPEAQQLVEAKVTNVVYQCLLLIEVQAATAERIIELCSLYTQFSQFANFPYGVLSWDDDEFPQSIEYVDRPESAGDTLSRLGAWLVNQDLGWRKHRLLLDSHELAALWHLPHNQFAPPQIAWTNKRGPLPQKMRGAAEGTRLGENRYLDRPEPVFIPDEDRATHINILGMTGVGKSTLLQQLITQDISRGLGVAVVDPHGKLISDLLRYGIPPEREEDVVFLDLSNTGYPPPLNPLVGARDHNATARIISVLEKVYGRSDNAPRMANALSSALMTLRCDPQATVRDIAMLFLNADYRAKLLETVDDEVTLEFWDYEYDKASPGQQQQIREPVLYRVRTFYRIADLYPIICHPQGLDFQKLMAEKKIILLSLAMDEERIPESERNLVGAMVVSQLQMAAMKQADRQTPFRLYIDEVQNFVTSALDEVFSEARKFGLSLTVANQYSKQLSGETLEAIMGNVGAMIVFQCGLDDARRLAPYMTPGFAAEDLLNLDKFEAVVKMRFKGETQPAFSLNTLAPKTVELMSDEEKAACIEREARIRALSVKRYTPLSRSEVMAWLSKRYQRSQRDLAMADAGDFFEE